MMVKFLLIILLLVKSYMHATHADLDNIIERYIGIIQELKKMASFGGYNMNNFVVAGMALNDLKKLCESDSYRISAHESRFILYQRGLIDANGEIYQFVKEAFKRMIINNQL